jgi:hypothetical protein
MLESWFADSGTWLRLVILLALMSCAVWVTFRTEKKKPPGVRPSG